MGSPTWFSGIGLREWGALPASNLNSSGVLESGTGHEVIDAWGGAGINKLGLYVGASFISGYFKMIWGGGHTNTDKNAIYAYGPYGANSPQWYRLRDSTDPGPTDVNVDGSGNPVSRHVYDSVFWWGESGNNKFYTIGALYTYIASLGFNDTYVYNCNQVSPNSNLPWSLTANQTDRPAEFCCVEPSSGLVWYWGYGSNGNFVGFYDPATDTYTGSLYKSPTWAGGNMTSAIDDNRGIWAIYCGNNGIGFYRTNNGVGNDYYVPTTTGTAPTGQGSILWDEVDDCFVLWVGGGKTIWKLTPPASSPYQGGNAWVWSSETPAGGSTPDTQNAQGTFKRFARIDNADFKGYTLLNNYNGDIYFFRTGGVVAGGPINAGKAMLLGVGG